MVTELNSENFKSEVLDFDGLVLVDFWASWCGPCLMLGPVIEELSEELKDRKDIKICRLNVDENSELAQKYNVMSIPILKFIRGGEVVDELLGLHSKEDVLSKLNSL